MVRPIHLLAQVRRATIADQRILLNWLLRKFKLQIAEWALRVAFTDDAVLYECTKGVRY